MVRTTVDCAFCGGTGRDPNIGRCPICYGKGKLLIETERNTELVKCAFCNGTGHDPNIGRCPVCYGAGVVPLTGDMDIIH
jgi:DnaJ-class molecular chaperone